MKAQKLGLVLGMNMAVACLVFQGCKVTKPNGAADMPPPVVDTGATVGETTTVPVTTAGASVVATDVAATTPSTTTASAVEVTTATEPAVEQPLSPSQVREVKPLPVAKKRPTAAVATAPASASAAASVGAAPSTVVVKRGDTLSAICVRNHVKMSAVVAANPGLNPNRILVGQKIVIPGRAVAAASAAAKSDKVMNAAAPAPVAASTTAPVKTKTSFKSYNGPTKEYKVRSGDMLGKIAYASGITVRALKEMNKLSSDTLKVGQVILVPAEKVVATKPAVEDVKKAGVKPAAKKSAAPVAEPVKASAEVTPPVTVAKPVQAPVVEAAASAAATVVAAPAVTAPAQAPVEAAVSDTAASAPVDATPASSAMTYTVKEGDDIVGVAIAWGISPSQLMDLNNLKAGEAIAPGQVLKLPANAKSAQ